MRDLVLYFFLLILRVLFNHTPDVIHKCSRFSKTSFEKSLEFVPCERVGSVSLSPSLMLLPPEIDPLLEEQSRKRYTFIAFSTNHFEIVLALPAKVIAFYVRAPIV